MDVLEAQAALEKAMVQAKAAQAAAEAAAKRAEEAQREAAAAAARRPQTAQRRLSVCSLLLLSIGPRHVCRVLAQA